MMGTRYLLEVSTSDCFLTEDFVKASLVKNVEHRFKIQGESRVVAIVTDCVDVIAANVVKGIPGTAHTKCTPLILYESFAKASLGLTDDEVQKKGAPAAFNPEKDTYWVEVNLGYEGHSVEEVLKVWHEEVVIAMGLMYGGEVAVRMYKCVFMKQVHMFIQIDGAAFDQLYFQLPLFKALGAHTQTTTRRLKPF